MKIIKPFQLNFQSQVVQQDNRFFFTVSATLGTQLISGERLLEPDWMKTALEGMGENPLPDTGMPKLSGEYLVSGHYYAPGGNPVTGGEIRVKLGEQEKQLLVFGPRHWDGGLPTKPEPFSSVAIDYKNAFGGSGFENNPDGIGYKDNLLPRIETSDQLITSPGDLPDTAGFSMLGPGWPQRTQFQGTYDDKYMEKYFPGYPADFDWRYFHCAPQDQWSTVYYRGDESFEIYNMHPEQPLLSGKLPGLYARCFINRNDATDRAEFKELDMNLDTIWFFPEQELALQTWRSTVEVDDDEATQINHVLLAYERHSDEARTPEHYKNSLNLRLDSDDSFLNNFKTQDLIPKGDKAAMALLFEDALKGVDDESALSSNMTAKSDAAQKHLDEQLENTTAQYKQSMPESDELRKEALPDIDKLLNNKNELAPDSDVEQFKQRMDKILPGLSSGDPKRIDFSNFSFSKIDEIMAAMNQLMDKKQGVADEQLAKLKQDLSKQIGSLDTKLGDIADEEKCKLQDMIDGLDYLDAKADVHKSPLPRLNADKIASSVSQLDPEAMGNILQLQTLKEMGVDNEQTQQIESLLGGSMDEQDEQLKQRLSRAESDFRDLYSKTAHFMEAGYPQHDEDLAEVAQRFLNNKRDVAEKDWAGIDLSNQDLAGIDLTGAYLEQVDFSGASLVGANLSGAILARAKLDGADLTGANLTAANVGAVSAIKTNFNGVNFHEAKLSRGDFSEADFTDAVLTDVETLDIILNNANFTGSDLTGLRIIEREIKGVNFSRSKLEASCFLQSNISDAVFDSADLRGCVWADTDISRTRFNSANLANNCFAVTEEAKQEGRGKLTAIDFSGANIEKANFQGIDMPDTNFTGATVINCNFNAADLSGGNLSQADMRQSQFRKAKLTGADLRESNFDQAFFAKAHLVSADLTGSNCYGVDFLGVTVGETKFDGCNLDATIFKDWSPG